MANYQDAIRYIKNQREKGFSDQKLKEVLQKAGWPEEDIESAFAEAGEGSETSEISSSESLQNHDIDEVDDSSLDPETKTESRETEKSTLSGETQNDSQEETLVMPVDNIHQELEDLNEESGVLDQQESVEVEQQELGEQANDQGTGEGQPKDDLYHDETDSQEVVSVSGDQEELNEAAVIETAESQSIESYEEETTKEAEEQKDQNDEGSAATATNEVKEPQEVERPSENKANNLSSNDDPDTDSTETVEQLNSVMEPPSPSSQTAEGVEAGKPDGISSAAKALIALFVFLLLAGVASGGYFLWQQRSAVFDSPEEAVVRALSNLSETSSLHYDLSAAFQAEEKDENITVGLDFDLSGQTTSDRSLEDALMSSDLSIAGKLHESFMELNFDMDAELRLVDNDLHLKLSNISEEEFLQGFFYLPIEEWAYISLEEAEQEIRGGLGPQAPTEIEDMEDIDWQKMMIDNYQLAFKHEILTFEEQPDMELDGEDLTLLELRYQLDPDSAMAYWKDYREKVKEYQFLPEELREEMLEELDNISEEEIEELAAISDKFDEFVTLEIAISQGREPMPRFFRMAFQGNISDLADPVREELTASPETEEGVMEYLREGLQAMVGGAENGLAVPGTSPDMEFEMDEEFQDLPQQPDSGDFREFPEPTPMEFEVPDIYIDMEIELILSDFDEPIELEAPEGSRSWEEVAEEARKEDPFYLSAQDANIRSELSLLRTSAEMYYMENDNDYSGVCKDENSGFVTLINSVLDQAPGAEEGEVSDHCQVSSDGQHWIVVAPLHDEDHEGFCVDSYGYSGEVNYEYPPSGNYQCE